MERAQRQDVKKSYVTNFDRSVEKILTAVYETSRMRNI